MKKVISASLIVIALAAQAAPAFAKDPCETVLCMAGMLQGEGIVSGCDGPVADFFDIVKFKRGKFKPSATKDARSQFVSSCPTNNGWADKITDKYGTVRM